MAHAQTTITQARQKISSNLLREIERLCGQKLTQVKDDKNNGRLVKALVISNSVDPSLTAMPQANPRGGRLDLLSSRFRGWHFGNAASQPAD